MKVMKLGRRYLGNMGTVGEGVLRVVKKLYIYIWVKSKRPEECCQHTHKNAQTIQPSIAYLWS